MKVCTAQEHIAGHGPAASRDGHAQITHRAQLRWKHRRNEAVLTKGVAMFCLRAALRSVVVVTLMVVAECVSGCAASVVMAQPMFIGDYSTGNFSQWPNVQNRGYNGPGLVTFRRIRQPWSTTRSKGKAARFEVRSGD